MRSSLPVPNGAIAAIVTHPEMFKRPDIVPAKPRADLSLHLVPDPDLCWYRALYRRIDEEWLWFSRAIMSDRQLSDVIHHPNVSVYVLRDTGHDSACWSLTGGRHLNVRLSSSASRRKQEAMRRGAAAWMMGEAQRL